MLRDEILDAARALISEKGYSAMSMDELALQVGISKPTLYSHFATKEDLVVAAAVREMDQTIALIEARADGQTPLQRLSALMRTIIRYHLDKGNLGLRPWMPELFQLICSHEAALDCMRRIDMALTALIREGIACGEIDPALDPATVTSAFAAMMSALRLAHLRGDAAPNMPAAADTLAAIFERGVRAPAPAESVLPAPTTDDRR